MLLTSPAHENSFSVDSHLISVESACVIYRSDAGMCKSVLIDVRCPSCISFNEAFSPVWSALRSPRGCLYVKQPHGANGRQRFPAILVSAGGQREMACIVYEALLLFCICKHLRGADREECCFSTVPEEYQCQQWCTSTGGTGRK